MAADKFREVSFWYIIDTLHYKYQEVTNCSFSSTNYAYTTSANGVYDTMCYTRR